MSNVNPNPVSRTSKALSAIRLIARAGVDLLFPPVCAPCGTREGPFAEPYLCQACRIKLLAPAPLPSTGPDVTGLSCALYEKTCQDLIRRAKFHADLPSARCLARLMADTLPAHLSLRPDMIISVPGDFRRIRRNGVDLPAFLGRRVASNLGVPFKRTLRRLRAAPQQKALTKAERLANLDGAFGLRRPVEDRLILVTDDVITTGATMQAVCRVLVSGGAKGVIFFAAARTPLRQCSIIPRRDIALGKPDLR